MLIDNDTPVKLVKIVLDLSIFLLFLSSSCHVLPPGFDANLQCYLVRCEKKIVCIINILYSIRRACSTQTLLWKLQTIEKTGMRHHVLIFINITTGCIRT